MKIYIPEPIAEAGEKYLEFQGYEIFRGSGQTDRESLIRDIAECDAMILRTAKMDEEVLEDGKKLRIVARHGAGYDNLDVKAAKERGIITTYSPDTTALSVAEMTITLLLMLAKKVKRMETELRKDNFSYKFSHKGMDVSGKTGTAEVDGVYHPNHGMFIGYAPATDPQYAIAVRIENGYSSGNACLAADDIFKYIFQLADEQTILTGVAASDTSDTSND